MTTKRKHIPTGEIYEKSGNHYHRKDRLAVPDFIVESGQDWELLDERIEVIRESGNGYKTVLTFNTNLSQDQMEAIEQLLNGESFTREDMWTEDKVKQLIGFDRKGYDTVYDSIDNVIKNFKSSDINR